MIRWAGVTVAFVLAVLDMFAAVFFLVGFVDVLGKSGTANLALYAAGTAALVASIGAIAAGIVQVARARTSGCWLLAAGSGLLLIIELVMIVFLSSRSDEPAVGAPGNAVALLGGLIVLAALAVVAATVPPTRRNVQLRAARQVS